MNEEEDFRPVEIPEKKVAKKKAAKKKRGRPPKESLPEVVESPEPEPVAAAVIPPRPGTTEKAGQKEPRRLAWDHLYGGGIDENFRTYDREAVAEWIAKYQAGEV